MKLLVVDDDIRFTSSLYSLFSESFTVHTASHAHSAIEKIKHNHYDLILLDLGLPDSSGAETYHQIRRHDPNVQVIVLSGETNISLKVSMLGNGIYDYLTKPIHAQELQVRLQRFLDKPKIKRPNQQLICGDLKIDPLRNIVSQNGRLIFLRSKEYNLLECLMINFNQPVAKEILINYVWEDAVVANNTLQVHINHLRSKIGLEGNLPRIITVHGYGYSLTNRKSRGKE